MVEEWYPNLEWGVKLNTIEMDNYSMDLWSNKNLEEKNRLLLQYSDNSNIKTKQ